MDFENMKRKQLQALCKEHGIPANLTNLEMANKLSSLLKVNDEKPLTRGRSCLKILDENVNDRESDVVNRKVKKVKFSPDNEIIEFTRSARVGRGGRRKAMSYKNNLSVKSDGLKVGILDSPVRVTRSQRVNMKDGVTEKRGRTRHVKDSVISVNGSKDEVGVTTKRTLKNKEVVIIQEKREENEGGDDDLRLSRRVRSRKNAKESTEESQEEPKIDQSEHEIERTHKGDKKVTFTSGGQMDEWAKSEIKAKDTKRATRRKSMAQNQKLPEVDAEVREEVAEKPARVTRSQNLKPVEDNVSNKRNGARGKKAIQTNDELLCTEFIESSVEAVKDEVRVNISSQKNSVLEAPEKALKRSGRRVANKEKGARLSDDVTKEQMVTRCRTRNQSNLTVEASTSESVEPKREHEVVLQLEEPVEVPLRRSDRRTSVFPLEKLRGDEAVHKENEDELRQKGIEEEPQKALKRSKRLATQVEDSVFAKGDIAENKLDRPTESQGTLEVVPQTREVPLRSNRRKSVVSSLEKVRSDEVVVVKEKRNLNANDGEIRSKGTKEEPQKASKRSKRLAKQMDDPVLANRDIVENKLEERRCSRRNVATASVETKILDSSVNEETSVVKEERRRSGRSAARHTVAAVSDDTKEKGENKLTKRNCTAIQEKDSTNKLTLQDLVSPKQSMSSSKASVKAAVVKKTSTSGKKQQGRLKRSNVEVEVPMPEDTEVVIEPDNKDCNISGSGGTMSFSRSSLNDLEVVPDDINIVLPGTKDDIAAESSTLADKLIEEGPPVEANSSPSEDNFTLKSLPFSDPFNSDARLEEIFVEELRKPNHEEPARKGACPSSVLADDAVSNAITSDKQEPAAISADNAEEFVTGLSNDVLDNGSLSQSDHTGEKLYSGAKDDAAAESSTLPDKLIEDEPLVGADASPSENKSTSDPFSESFNSNARPKENLDEELLQFDHEAAAGKDLCPSPVLDEDAAPNEISSDKEEHGSIAADNAEELSDKVLDDCSLSQNDNMKESPDSGFKGQSKAGCVVTEGVIYGEQESASKILCPSSLADDAVPNDITSHNQKHGAVVADFEEVDPGLSNEVLDNMEENLDDGLNEQSESGCIVKEGVTYCEQELESKGLCPSSVLAEDAVPNDITSDKLEHGAIAADNAEEFDSGSSNEVLDNCSVNHSDNMEEKLDSGFKEQSESRCTDSVGVNSVEQELTITDYAKEYDVGLPNNVLLDNLDAFHQSNEMEVEFSEAEDESGPTEQAEVESSPVEAKCGPDAPIFTSQGETHAEECTNLEAAASEKTVSSPIKAVLDLQTAEPDILGDGIRLHVTPSEDSDEDKQGEELKSLFATPCYVSHSKEEKKASLDGDSRDEDLNREGQDSPISGYDTSGLYSSVRDGGEHGQGEYLKILFATPFGSRSSKVEIATGSAINETSSQYQHSCHETEEDLKGLFATPSVVSQSVRDQHYLFQSQLSGEAMNKREGLDSSRKENSSKSVRGLIENKQVEHVRTLFASPVSVKCTNQETTSSKGKYSQSSEMKTYICSGVERNLGESDAGSVGVNQAPETSHVTAFKYGDDNEHENQLKMLFASPIITQSLDQMDGTSRKTENKNLFLSGSVHGLCHNQVFPAAQQNAMDLDEPQSIDSRHSREQIKFEKIKETAKCMKESSALEEENSEGQGNMLSAMSAKSMSPLWNDEFSSQEPKPADVAKSDEMVRDTEITTRHESYVQEIVDIEEHKIEETMADRDLLLFSSQKPKTADVTMSREMARDTEMSTRHESCVQEIGDIEEHRMEEMVADKDLLQRSDISRSLKEDVSVGIANERSSPVIADPICDDIGYSEQQMVPEYSIKNVKASDAFNEGTVDHLKLLFAPPIKATSPSKLGEASSCQLKTAAIVVASEMAGKQPKQGFEFSGEPLTVEILSGGSNWTKRSCFSKEIEQFEGGPLFPTPSKGIPLQSEESLGCEEDILNYLDGVKFPNNRERKFAQQGDREPLNEMTDDAGEATLDWFQTNDDNVPTQMELKLETQNENNSAHLFEPLHEEREVTEDDALAEGNEDDHLVAYQESLEDGLINTYGAAKVGDVSDAVCQQPNIPLTDIETENTTQESTRKSDGISVSAESGILEFDAESTALRSQETIIITVEETKGDEVQKLEVRKISNAFLQNIPNDGEYAKMSSTVLPADEQFHFPEHYVVENVSGTEEFTASPYECQQVSKEDDLGTEEDRLVIIESNESMSMNVGDSGLTKQIDLPGIFATESSNKTHSSLFEETQSGSDQGRFSADKQQDENLESELSPSSKSRENISFIKEGIAGEGTLTFEKKDDLVEMKVPLTPAASVAKTSFAKHLNSTVKNKNARSILIHGTPNKLTQIADMKENAPSVKGDISTLIALRPEKRPALKDLSQK